MNNESEGHRLLYHLYIPAHLLQKEETRVSPFCEDKDDWRWRVSGQPTTEDGICLLIWYTFHPACTLWFEHAYIGHL